MKASVGVARPPHRDVNPWFEVVHRTIDETVAVVVGGVLALTDCSAGKAVQIPQTLEGIMAVMCWYSKSS